MKTLVDGNQSRFSHRRSKREEQNTEGAQGGETVNTTTRPTRPTIVASKTREQSGG